METTSRTTKITKVQENLYTVSCTGHGFTRQQARLSSSGSLSLGVFIGADDAAEAAKLFLETGDATLTTGKELSVR